MHIQEEVWRLADLDYSMSKSNIHIIDSYQVKSKKDMEAIAQELRIEGQKRGFTYKRSNSSWVTEWRAHNYMYEKGTEKERTGSVDLNENESRWKLLSYSLMSLLYRG